MDLAARLSSLRADIRDKLRFARTQQALARRQRDPHRLHLCRRLIRQCLHALRYAARIEAGAEPTGPAGPACVFSESPENVFQSPTPPVTPDSDRRRTFRERLRRW